MTKNSTCNRKCYFYPIRRIGMASPARVYGISRAATVWHHASACIKKLSQGWYAIPIEFERVSRYAAPVFLEKEQGCTDSCFSRWTYSAKEGTMVVDWKTLCFNDITPPLPFLRFMQKYGTIFSEGGGASGTVARFISDSHRPGCGIRTKGQRLWSWYIHDDVFTAFYAVPYRRGHHLYHFFLHYPNENPLYC